MAAPIRPRTLIEEMDFVSHMQKKIRIAIEYDGTGIATIDTICTDHAGVFYTCSAEPYSTAICGQYPTVANGSGESIARCKDYRAALGTYLA